MVDLSIDLVRLRGLYILLFSSSFLFLFSSINNRHCTSFHSKRIERVVTYTFIYITGKKLNNARVTILKEDRLLKLHAFYSF